MSPQRLGAALVIREGRFAGTRYELSGEEVLIGRNPTTDITLLDENASREHAILSWDEASGSYNVEDLQSTNGTKVNGKRVRAAALAHRDCLEVGLTKFDFLINGGD